LLKLEERVRSSGQPKKQQFRSVEKAISQSFQWSTEERDSLAKHLESKGFSVLVCPTEADMQIAKDCQPSDVVISGDSDLLLYSSINTVWRPVTKAKILVYNIQLYEPLESPNNS